VTSGAQSGFEPAPRPKSARAATSAHAAPARTSSPTSTPELATDDAGSEFGP
jgi:hypothetical protein